MIKRTLFEHKKNATQPTKLKNVATATNGIKVFKSPTCVANTFSQKYHFPKQLVERLESKISDVLKCKDGLFNILGKLIWQSDARFSQSRSQYVREATVINSISYGFYQWGTLVK